MTRKMKDSGIEWIGEIPENWGVSKVKNAFLRKNKKAMQENPVVLSLARSGVKVRDISNNEGQIAESYYNYNPVQQGDLLINPMDLYSGANCSISNVEGVISPAYINLSAKNGYDARYYDFYFKIQYWLMAFFAYGKGVSFENRWTLNTETLMNYSIICPEYKEQKKIRNYIGRKCSRIDETIKKENQIIQKLKEYKQSVITEAVTKGLNTGVKMKGSGIEWIGEIPEEWRLPSLSKCAEIGSGGTPNRNKPEYWENGNIPWMSSGEINNEYIYNTCEKITEEGLNNSSTKILPIHTVMLGLIGQGKTKGLTAILYIEATCNQNLAYMLAKNDLLYYKYLFYCFKSMYKYLRGVIGESQAGIYLNFLKALKIPLPTIEEQRQIAEYLDKKCAAIDKTVVNKEKLIEKLNEYKKSLIYECVTGKREV